MIRVLLRLNAFSQTSHLYFFAGGGLPEFGSAARLSGTPIAVELGPKGSIGGPMNPGAIGGHLTPNADGLTIAGGAKKGAKPGAN